VRIPRSSHSPSDRGPETPKSQGLIAFQPTLIPPANPASPGASCLIHLIG